MNRPSQAAETQTVHRDLVAQYDTDSWYAAYAVRFMRVANAQPGERILDLCCGTGLGTVIAAGTLARQGKPGDGGVVTGIDCCAEMVSAAKYKFSAEPDMRSRVAFLLHDVSALDGLDQMDLRAASFDMLYCSNAFTLLHSPEAVVRQWRRLLKPPCPLHGNGNGNGESHGGCNGSNGSGYNGSVLGGRSRCKNKQGGRLVIDIPHRRFELAALAMERVARQMGLQFPSNRAWVLSDTTFVDMLRRQGFHVENIVRLNSASGRPAVHNVKDSLDMFEDMARSSRFQAMLESGPSSLARATVVNLCRLLFQSEMTALVGHHDGTIWECDVMHVYVARRVD